MLILWASTHHLPQRHSKERLKSLTVKEQGHRCPVWLQMSSTRASRKNKLMLVPLSYCHCRLCPRRGEQLVTKPQQDLFKWLRPVHSSNHRSSLSAQLCRRNPYLLCTASISEDDLHIRFDLQISKDLEMRKSSPTGCDHPVSLTYT